MGWHIITGSGITRSRPVSCSLAVPSTCVGVASVSAEDRSTALGSFSATLTANGDGTSHISVSAGNLITGATLSIEDDLAGLTYDYVGGFDLGGDTFLVTDGVGNIREAFTGPGDVMHVLDGTDAYALNIGHSDWDPYPLTMPDSVVFAPPANRIHASCHVERADYGTDCSASVTVGGAAFFDAISDDYAQGWSSEVTGDSLYCNIFRGTNADLDPPYSSDLTPENNTDAWATPETTIDYLVEAKLVGTGAVDYSHAGAATSGHWKRSWAGTDNQYEVPAAGFPVFGAEFKFPNGAEGPPTPPEYIGWTGVPAYLKGRFALMESPACAGLPFDVLSLIKVAFAEWDDCTEVAGWTTVGGRTPTYSGGMLFTVASDDGLGAFNLSHSRDFDAGFRFLQLDFVPPAGMATDGSCILTIQPLGLSEFHAKLLSGDKSGGCYVTHETGFWRVIVDIASDAGYYPRTGPWSTQPPMLAGCGGLILSIPADDAAYDGNWTFKDVRMITKAAKAGQLCLVPNIGHPYFQGPPILSPSSTLYMLTNGAAADDNGASPATPAALIARYPGGDDKGWIAVDLNTGQADETWATSVIPWYWLTPQLLVDTGFGGVSFAATPRFSSVTAPIGYEYVWHAVAYIGVWETGIVTNQTQDGPVVGSAVDLNLARFSEVDCTTGPDGAPISIVSSAQQRTGSLGEFSFLAYPKGSKVVPFEHYHYQALAKVANGGPIPLALCGPSLWDVGARQDNFSGLLLAEGVCIEINHWGWIFVGFVTGGLIGITRRINGTDETFSGLFAGSSPSLYYDHNDQAAKLWMVYSDGGAVQRRSSIDNGGTWSVATPIVAVGTYPFAKKDQITGMWLAIYHDGTGFSLQRFWPDWSANGGPSTVVATAPEGAAALDLGKDSGHTMTAVYADSGGAVQRVVSTDNGVTWA